MEEVEEVCVLAYQFHHLPHTFHLHVSLEGVYSHKVDLLSLFLLPEQGFLVAKREAFLEKMGVEEEAWELGVLVESLLEAAVASPGL